MDFFGSIYDPLTGVLMIVGGRGRGVNGVLIRHQPFEVTEWIQLAPTLFDYGFAYCS
jgi:hypothetical protein